MWQDRLTHQLSLSRADDRKWSSTSIALMSSRHALGRLHVIWQNAVRINFPIKLQFSLCLPQVVSNILNLWSKIALLVATSCAWQKAWDKFKMLGSYDCWDTRETEYATQKSVSWIEIYHRNKQCECTNWIVYTQGRNRDSVRKIK